MKLCILVTGSRNETSRQRIKAGLIEAAKLAAPDLTNIESVRLIHGAARGADTIAGAIGVEKGWSVYSCPADWNKHGNKAGPIRNAEMVQLALRFEAEDWMVVCAAFPLPGSIGTHDCVRQARAASFQVYVAP